MLAHYFSIALRNIARHRLYTFINVAGLAAAIASAVLILLYVRDDLGFDRAAPEGVYRVETDLAPPGGSPAGDGSSSFALAEALRSDVPGIVETLRLSVQSSVVQAGDRQAFEAIAISDPNFFTMLGYRLVRGDPALALVEPDTMVVSESFGRKYFGDEDPVGKTLILDNTHPVRITAVMADLPYNTQLKIAAILPFGSRADSVYGTSDDSRANALSWTNFGTVTYARLAPGTDPAGVVASLPDLLRKRMNPAAGKVDLSGSSRFALTLFRDQHFGHPTSIELISNPTSDWPMVRNFALIAILILVIASINFMNLSTARATMRAREVGLRKMVGARRRQLVSQFLGESVLISIAALALGMAIVELVLPAYAGFVGRPLGLNYLRDWDVSLGIAALALMTGIAGGLYPAFVLAAFRPAVTLGSRRGEAHGSPTLRSSLVVIQFAISIALGAVATVVYGQTVFARDYDVGFARQDIVLLQGIGRDQVIPLRDTLRHELLASPHIKAIAGSNDRPFSGYEFTTPVRLPHAPDDVLELRQLYVEPEFFDVYGIPLVAGRPLSRDRGQDLDSSTGQDVAPDGTSMLINEAAVRRLGFASPEQAIGERVLQTGRRGSADEDKLISRVIVGVVADAHFDGLRRPIAPQRFMFNPGELNYLNIVVDSAHMDAALRHIEEVWSRLVPDLPPRIRLLENDYQTLYADDEHLATLFTAFTVVAILIASLGLFGLAAFSVERRTKEIGIRKVFGAGVADIVRMLLWQFSKPVLVANLIAWPLAWIYLSDWLAAFAYRIELSPLYFAAAGLGALLIASATVSGHAIRVARTRPIHALRYE